MQGGPGADEESSQGPATAQQLQQKSKDRTPLSVRDNAQLAELADAARVVRQAKEQAKREARRASKEGTQAAAGKNVDEEAKVERRMSQQPCRAFVAGWMYACGVTLVCL
jgi:hypothetical protein